MQKKKGACIGLAIFVALIAARAPACHALHLAVVEAGAEGMRSADAFLPAEDTRRGSSTGLLPPHPFELFDQARAGADVPGAAEPPEPRDWDAVELLTLVVAGVAAMGFVSRRRRPPN